MNSEDSVSRWIDQVKVGNEEAAQLLWDRYFPQLMDVAGRRLGGVSRAIADEEDIALNALSSFFQAARAGQCADIKDRQELARLLFKITERKAIDMIRYHCSAKRLRPSRENNQSMELQDPSTDFGLYDQKRVGDQLAIAMTSEFQSLFAALKEPELRLMALAKLEGRTNEEIADQFDCSVRTVERRLQKIRRRWQNRLSHETLS